MLQTLLSAASARAVVCYGKGYDNNWAKLLNVPMIDCDTVGVRWKLGVHDGVPVAIVPHPVSHGIHSVFWIELGKRLREPTA